MTPTSRFVRQLVRSESGTSMVEFAIVAPLLILFATGVIDIGRAFKQFNTLSQAVRDGARYASAHPTATQARIAARVDSTFQSGLGASKASTNAQVNFSADGQQVTVTVVNYSYDPLTPVIPAQALQFTASAVFRRKDAPAP